MARPSDLPPETFARRRRRLFDELGDRALVLPASAVSYASRDTEHRYRPDSELAWVSGATEPGTVAVLRGHADEERFVLFTTARDPEAELWTGPRLGPDGARERYGADAAWPLEELEARLPDLLLGSRALLYRLGRRDRVERTVLRTLERARVRGARKGDGPRGILDPGVVLDDMRLRKEPAELERMRRAAALTVEAHRAAMARARPGVGEWEVEAWLESAFRSGGGDGPAYGTIVASGENARVLHYVANRDTLGAGDTVLVDAGASYGLYAADVTRTWPANGRFTPEQRILQAVVDEARRRGVEAVAPGVPVGRVHDAAVGALVEGLVEMGVLRGAVEELVEAGAYKPFFPHQTSHWLGLDVHDVGDYARGGESRLLEPGMVLTVEPGLYFAPEAAAAPAAAEAAEGSGGATGGGGRHGSADPGEDRAASGPDPSSWRVPGGADPWIGSGCRLEDDVLVTEDGHEVLTPGLPSDPEGVEGLMG